MKDSNFIACFNCVTEVLNNIVLLIFELTTDFGKSFHMTNLLMVLISDNNLSIEHIGDARVPRLLIHEVRYVQGTKLAQITYRPVFVCF